MELCLRSPGSSLSWRGRPAAPCVTRHDTLDLQGLLGNLQHEFLPLQEYRTSVAGTDELALPVTWPYR